MTDLPSVGSVCLNSQQSMILQLVLSHISCLITGSAGTGKSLLLQEIIKAVRSTYPNADEIMAITASTAMAACHIGGTTLHAFAGIGLGEGTKTQLVQRLKSNPAARSRLQRTRILIIDEISMVDGDLLQNLCEIFSAVRGNIKPFGGIQVIFVGDFFQLPPITKNRQPKFAFETVAWKNCITETFKLSEVFRQKDQEFVNLLNEMRIGKLSPKYIKLMKSLSRSIRREDGFEPTELFPLRTGADQANTARLNALAGSIQSFYANDTGTVSDQERDQKLRHLLAPQQLNLKVGAQVILIKNRPGDNVLVNGSGGIVLGFLTKAEWRMKSGDFWRTTDMSIETAAGGAIMDNDLEQYPVVQFKVAGYPHGLQQLVTREVWTVEFQGKVQASRKQIPLVLGWAMSIHKSQGQTLELVKVDLSYTFEKGQAYVAISRATSLEGLQVVGFHESKVTAHPTVVRWYMGLG